MTTLRKSLTQAKCSMPSKIRPRNTRNNEWPSIGRKETEGRIVAWEEVTVETLNASYGHLLDEHINEELIVPFPNPALATIEVQEQEFINHLIHWSDQVLGPTLEFARAKLDIETGTALTREVAPTEKKGAPGKLRLPGGGRAVPLDHLIQLDTEYRPTLVVGLGRSSYSFPGRNLLNSLLVPTRSAGELEGIWPLRRLANLCYLTQTRYGYILTDQDMVVCCFTSNNPLGKPNKSKWSVAIKTIAWTKTGEQQLTTDLALWWLCMLAISAPKNRVLARPQDTTKINAWSQPFTDEKQPGVWFRRHRFSQRVEETAAPPVPPYEAPAPDNMEGQYALFMAGAGLNADPHFDFNADPFPAGDNLGEQFHGGEQHNVDNFDFNAYFGPNQN